MGELEEMKLLFMLPVPANVGAKGGHVNQPRVMIKKTPFTMWLTGFITESYEAIYSWFARRRHTLEQCLNC